MSPVAVQAVLSNKTIVVDRAVKIGKSAPCQLLFIIPFERPANLVLHRHLPGLLRR